MDCQITEPLATAFIIAGVALASSAFVYLAVRQNKLFAIGGCLMGNDEVLGAKLDAGLANDERILNAVANLSGDFGGMAGEIAELKADLAAAGTTSPENLAKADALVAKSGEIADKLEALAAQYPPAPVDTTPVDTTPVDTNPDAPAGDSAPDDDADASETSEDSTPAP